MKASRSYWTEDAIVLSIQEWTRQRGATPRVRDWNTGTLNGDWPPATEVKNRFGSWNAAIRAAGLVPRPAATPSSRGPVKEVRIYLDVATYRALTEIARRSNVSLSEVVRDCCEEKAGPWSWAADVAVIGRGQA